MDSHADIQSLGQTSQKQQITTFVDDVTPQNFEKPMPSSVTQWTSMAKDSDVHSIVDILKRPVIVDDGQFGSGLEDSEVFNLKFPDVLLQKSLNLVKKLDYFTYFRANVKVRFVFNATPFQAGRYWMAFSPYNESCNRGMRVDYPNYTGYPGTEVDIASGAAVELKIPYCSPLSHYNLVDGHSTMGHLIMKTLSPIASGTMPSDCSYTLFAWFEDIELTLPTSQPVAVPVLLAQAFSEELEKSDRPVSGTLSKIGSVAGYVADNVPVLSSFARPVQWVSRILGGVASIFGFNKPTSLTDSTPMYNMPAKGFTNAEGIDHSVKLAAMPDNGLTLPQGLFSTDVDEMDLSYIASKSCMFDRFNWKTDTTVLTNISYFPVCPGVTNQRSPADLDYIATTVGFLNSMFKYWRGGIKYRLSVAKTAFHSGRLRITYHPAVNNLASPGTIYQNAYNWILDLSLSSELEFEVPYVSNMPWKRTYVGTPDEINALGEMWSTGLVTVQVLTPLKAVSGQVSTTVQCMLWISGSQDISFAIPTFEDYAPTIYGSPATTEILQAQILNETNKGIEHNEQMTNSAEKMFGMRSMDKTMPEQLCMGEKISSLRQLIKRFGVSAQGYPFPWRKKERNEFAYMGPVPFDDTNLPYLQNVIIDPAYFGAMSRSLPYDDDVVAPMNTVAISRDGTGAVTYGTQFLLGTISSCVTPIQYISTIFRFFTGGKRYKMLLGSNTTSTYSVQIYQKPPSEFDVPPNPPDTTIVNTCELHLGRADVPFTIQRQSAINVNGNIARPVLFEVPGAQNVDNYNSTYRHVVYPDLNGALEFEVPYYGITPISLVAEGVIPTDDGICVARSSIRISRGLTQRENAVPCVVAAQDSPFPRTTEATLNYIGCFQLLEAAADDFTFGYLVGAPSLRRLT